MNKLKSESRDRPTWFWDRVQEPRAALQREHRSDMIDRLFGDLTHFSFVVELGAKNSREKFRS